MQINNYKLGCLTFFTVFILSWYAGTALQQGRIWLDFGTLIGCTIAYQFVKMIQRDDNT